MKLTVESWQKVIDSVLRPARPELARCFAARQEHLVARQAHASERVRAIKDCELRIEQARSVVFAANDGIVSARMTELEREWRRLSRPDPEARMMDLWSRIAPPSWIDRKRWRDSDPEQQLDAALALASDVEGVEIAEAAVLALRPKARIRWRLAEQDSTHFRALVPESGNSLDSAIHLRALAYLPERPLLARDIAHAAFYATIAPRSVSPLIALWKSGYVIAAVDDASVTLEIPAL